MVVKLSNNVRSSLRTEVLSGSTTILLPVGHGARFPALGAGEYFYATIEDAAGNYEIVRVTARATDTLTATRGAEGTTARTFAAGSTIEMRVTAASVLDAAQDAADTVDLAQFSVTASAAEINILDGALLSTAELNILDGVTASTAEINILDGVTASTAEINILDGVTATTAEINKLAGTPAGLTATELGYVDGVTSSIQTQLDAKQPLDADLTAIAALSSGGLIVRTGAGTATVREVMPGTGITVTNGVGISGNPTVAADLASQAEAQAGTDTTKLMTPQRVLQSITANSTVLLSTLTTVTGNTYTTPTLDLTPYKFVTAIVEGLGDNSATSGNFSIFGLALVATGTTAANRIYGSWTLELRTGLFFGLSQVIAPAALPQVFAIPANTGGRTALSNATTTFTVSMAITTFAAGNVTFYGVR